MPYPRSWIRVPFRLIARLQPGESGLFHSVNNLSTLVDGDSGQATRERIATVEETPTERAVTSPLIVFSLLNRYDTVSSGLYQTASEVVREALRLLNERDQERERLRADVQAGFDQLARGQGTRYDKASGRRLSERIKADRRLAHTKKR